MVKRLRIYLIVASVLCMVAATLLISACGKEGHIHSYGEWEETAPSCEAAGQSMRQCSGCGDVQSQTIEKLGHDWDNGIATKEASCEEDGVMTYVCKRDAKHTYTEPITKLGHDWQEVDILIYPTCEDEGLRSAVCSRCDARTDEQIIPALEHDWEIVTIKTETCRNGGEYLHTCKRIDCSASKTTTTEPVDHKWSVENSVEVTCESNGTVTYKCEFDCGTPRVDTINAIGHIWGDWQILNAAACTTQGLEERSCTRTGCIKSETRAVKALGHSFSNSYTVDVEPTYDNEGTQSKHCTRNGCNVTSEPQAIPRLAVTYTVTIRDSCGSYYYGSATIEFYVNGVLVESVPMADSRVNTISLHSPNCNVMITGLNKGYYANEEGYDLSVEKPSVTVCLGASVMDAPKEQLPFYKTGSVLYDQEYVYYGPNDQLVTTTLKQILESKKGIIMNFYFNLCSPCNSEMSALISASQTYQEDVAILMVNYYETENEIRAFRERNNVRGTPLMFLNAESSKYTFRDFASVVKNFPTSAFIDCNGQVVDMHVGGMTQSGFGSSINSFIINRYNTLHPSEANSNNIAPINTEVAILPSKKFGF